MSVISPAARVAPMPSRQSVLIVDDNPIVLRALAKLLNSHGLKAITSSTATEAMRELAKAIPAAAVVDVHLPDESGLVLTQRLRQCMGKEAPIIIVSGDGSSEVLSSLSRVGASHFFSKPISARALVQRLATLLGFEMNP